MARAHSIWTVQDPGVPPECFTVRHELVSWLEKNANPGGRVIWRGHDGRRKAAPPVMIALADLGIED
jgi:hypothetical protein